MRTMIIGDVHGCSNALKKLLEKVQPTGTDKIVMLGDLFDRGPDSYGVFETVRALAKEFGERFVLLRGNHEDYHFPCLSVIDYCTIWQTKKTAYLSSQA